MIDIEDDDPSAVLVGPTHARDLSVAPGYVRLAVAMDQITTAALETAARTLPTAVARLGWVAAGRVATTEFDGWRWRVVRQVSQRRHRS